MHDVSPAETASEVSRDVTAPLTAADILATLREGAVRIVLASMLVGLIALGATYLIQPVFTARSMFLPPQQQQSSAANALASLGALAGMAGGSLPGLRSPAEQYVALMQSRSVTERIVDEFKLLDVYGHEYKTQALRTLERNTRINVGKKDGLITVEVDDHDPTRASAMANRYVDELRRLTANLALSEAQQRRVFFEQQLNQTRDKLARAQQALERSGIGEGALRAEPKAAAESYARLRAEVTAAEVRLQALRGSMHDGAPEVRTQQATLGALREELAKAQRNVSGSNDPDYIGRYREFKYQETLFELFARQYELARVDESREGGLIQIVDVAVPPELKSWPKRGLVAMSATAAALVLLSALAVLRSRGRPRSRAVTHIA